MICGDFNLVIDPRKDYFNYKHINNKKSRDTLLNHISIRDLIDPFRQLNPDKLCYTWRKRNPIQQARLDFFLISPPLNTFMISSSIENSFMSDHSIISTNLQINEFQYSSGLWKHDNALLAELDYINTINTKIEEIKKQYALPVYDRNHLKEIPNSEIQFTINDQLFLKTLLMEIRGKSISYGSFRKKKVKNERELEIQSKIKLLEENLSQSNLDEYYLLRNEVEQLQKEKMKGSIIRSRVKWNIDGEKPTRFFCGLEKSNTISKTVQKIIKDDGSEITNQKQILEEIKTFYETLYTSNQSDFSDINFDGFISNLEIPRLSVKESESIEGKITMTEAFQTLKKYEK